MFRYDRPQAGRYRVFNHFGIEAIGDGAPGIDAESLDLITSYYAALGLNDYTLLLNSIGDGNCRPAYIEKLRAYYADKLDRMCGDCRRRYEVNPLRLLDCKNEPCQPFKADAPKIADNLCEPCAEHFAAVRSLLDELGIKYVLTPTLVRGLHYYTRTTFEIEPGPDGSLSAMTKSAVSIAGGGRYDGLIEELGGQPTPGIGFGTGLERLIINLKRQGSLPPETPGVDVFVAVMSFEAQLKSVALARNLRGVGLNVVMGAAGRSLRAQLRHANALGARYALVIGAEELANDSVSLRDLTTSEQERVPAADIASRLRR
jgi:histidyl-tRNA synthetase